MQQITIKSRKAFHQRTKNIAIGNRTWTKIHLLGFPTMLPTITSFMLFGFLAHPIKL